MDSYTPEEIKQRLKSTSITKLATQLQLENPGSRGFSEKSVKRFCSEHNIRKRPHSLGLSDAQLDEEVSQAISEVGDSYGKRMMKGYLDSKAHAACVASESRVLSSLNRVSTSESKEERAYGARRIANPSVYSATYFGEKWHIDQNEKLTRYGVVVVCMTDGFSRLIVGHSVMREKNNIIIYDEVYRSAVLKYGLVTQMRADHGMEFSLVDSVQRYLSHLRVKQDKVAVARTVSTKNLPIERFWCEVNIRVLYPIKKQLILLEDHGSITLPDDKQFISVVCQKCVKIGLKRCIDAWNTHSIRGRGKPIDLAQDRSNLHQLSTQDIPDASTAAELYPGRLTGRPSKDEQAEGLLDAAVDLEDVYRTILAKESSALLLAITKYKHFVGTS